MEKSQVKVVGRESGRPWVANSHRRFSMVVVAVMLLHRDKEHVAHERACKVYVQPGPWAVRPLTPIDVVAWVEPSLFNFGFYVLIHVRPPDVRSG